MAEIIAVSFAGGRWGRMAVPAGLAVPVSLPPADGPPALALVLDGVNRSCFDAYGGPLGRLFQERALGLRGRKPPVPLLLGTFLEGPSCLPPAPAVLALGPVFHTDYLSWRASLTAATPQPGECALTAWEATPVPVQISDLLNEVSNIPNIHWERGLASAGAVLAGLPDGAPVGPALLFAWIVPFLLGNGVVLADVPEAVRDHWREHARDSRLGPFLRAHGMEFD